MSILNRTVVLAFFICLIGCKSDKKSHNLSSPGHQPTAKNVPNTQKNMSNKTALKSSLAWSLTPNIRPAFINKNLDGFGQKINGAAHTPLEYPAFTPWCNLREEYSSQLKPHPSLEKIIMKAKSSKSLSFTDLTNLFRDNRFSKEGTCQRIIDDKFIAGSFQMVTLKIIGDKLNQFNGYNLTDFNTIDNFNSDHISALKLLFSYRNDLTNSNAIVNFYDKALANLLSKKLDPTFFYDSSYYALSNFLEMAFESPNSGYYYKKFLLLLSSMTSSDHDISVYLESFRSQVLLGISEELDLALLLIERELSLDQPTVMANIFILDVLRSVDPNTLQEADARQIIDYLLFHSSPLAPFNSTEFLLKLTELYPLSDDQKIALNYSFEHLSQNWKGKNYSNYNRMIDFIIKSPDAMKTPYINTLKTFLPKLNTILNRYNIFEDKLSIEAQRISTILSMPLADFEFNIVLKQLVNERFPKYSTTSPKGVYAPYTIFFIQTHVNTYERLITTLELLAKRKNFSVVIHLLQSLRDNTQLSKSDKLQAQTYINERLFPLTKNIENSLNDFFTKTDIKLGTHIQLLTFVVAGNALSPKSSSHNNKLFTISESILKIFERIESGELPPTTNLYLIKKMSETLVASTLGLAENYLAPEELSRLISVSTSKNIDSHTSFIVSTYAAAKHGVVDSRLQDLLNSYDVDKHFYQKTRSLLVPTGPYPKAVKGYHARLKEKLKSIGYSIKED